MNENHGIVVIETFEI